MKSVKAPIYTRNYAELLDRGGLRHSVVKSVIRAQGLGFIYTMKVIINGNVLD